MVLFYKAAGITEALNCCDLVAAQLRNVSEPVDTILLTELTSYRIELQANFGLGRYRSFRYIESHMGGAVVNEAEVILFEISRP